MDSTLGAGSTFWFELPLRVSARAAVEPEPKHTRFTATRPRLRGLRILAVDDNRINLFILERALQLEGASVQMAADGQQALRILDALPDQFDAVLMDIQMPVMDGLSATRAIRSNPRLAGLPVIALTAGGFSEDRQSALAAGMNDVLAKPVNLDQMVAVLAGVARPARFSQDGGAGPA